jgi:hypothetical protein
MNVQFATDAHRAFFTSAVKKANCANDLYRLALFYTLGLHSELRRNIYSLYDFKEQRILFEGLTAPWQTSGTLRATRLAFNLYNGFVGDTGDGYTESGALYTPYELFCDGSSPYFFEAVKLRYPEYCRNRGTEYYRDRNAESEYDDELEL